MPASFRILEDIAIADVAFEATGNNLSELFVAAAEAVIDIVANPTTVAKTWHCRIERENDQVADLLFDWLSEMVYLKDAEGVVFCEAMASVVHDSVHRCWRLHGNLNGETIDPSRHELRSDVKAVTRHLYAVWENKEQWMARVVLDI
ncbi:MAG TPA: archease [Nitrospiraceae bacterium]|nr:archease [Nitrospiraceae bacterium]